MVDGFEQVAWANARVLIVRSPQHFKASALRRRMVGSYREKLGGLQLGRVIRLCFLGHKVQYLFDRSDFL
jgi:hypothetical protein